MTIVLMLASVGHEIVHCGGTLALHVKSGDAVHAAVPVSHPENRTHLHDACAILGVTEVTFLDFAPDTLSNFLWKDRIIELIRVVKPTIIIMQDPQCSEDAADPMCRAIGHLFADALHLAGRWWHIDECGGYPPHRAHSIFYMTSQHPNCVVEINETFELKQQALATLGNTIDFGMPPTFRWHATDTAHVDKYAGSGLGLSLHRAFDKACAFTTELAGHLGEVVGEVYRREGVFG